MGDIRIVDVTLRDGEQTAGVVFANKEKIQIAKMLDELGVDQIEAGIPIMGGDEFEAVKAIAKLGLKADVIGWNRAVIKDIEASLRCGVNAVAISISTSDIHIQHKLKTTREQVLENMVKAVNFAKREGVYISVNAEDASRTDIDFMIEFAKIAKETGANRIRYCDTVGIMDPFKIMNTIATIKKNVDIDIEMHTHNDFGMATANAIAGVLGGAEYVGVTVNGLGERAGNAALEEVVMGLKHVLGKEISQNPKKLRELSYYVANASGRKIPTWKAIVGDNIFAHESGIHADGALKYPKTYEVFEPSEVGLERKIVIGKHSGTAAIIKNLNDKGYDVNHDIAEMVLSKVRTTAIELKRTLNDRELIYIYHESLRESGLLKKEA